MFGIAKIIVLAFPTEYGLIEFWIRPWRGLGEPHWSLCPVPALRSSEMDQ